MISKIVDIKPKLYTISDQAIGDLAAEFFGKPLTATDPDPTVLSFEFKTIEITEDSTVAADILSNLFVTALDCFRKPKKK